jgi:hypothetical protein
VFKHLLKAYKDRISGGLADDKQPSDFDSNALKEGVSVEKEHTSDPAVAQEIAMDHLTEDKKYYKKLATIENKKIEKGAMRRLASFKPQSLDMPVREEMETWQEEQPRDARDVLSEVGMSREAKMRALHKLHRSTKVRKNPISGEREFLLHRGLRSKNQSTSEQPNSNTIKYNNTSSWTPHYAAANEFKQLYNGQIASAWIPERHIRFIPKQYGTWSGDPKEKPTKNHYEDENNVDVPEHEIIVEPHKATLVSGDELNVLTDGQSSNDFSPKGFAGQSLHQRINQRGMVANFKQNRKKPIVKSDPMGMNSLLGKSNYGPKGMGQYNQADNVRRKQSNANEVITAPGNVKVKTGANASGGQGKQRLHQEMKQLASKNRKQPVKQFSAEEIAQMNAARGLKKNAFKGWTPKKALHPKDPLNQKNPPRPPDPKWNDRVQQYFESKKKLQKDENTNLGHHIIFSAENSPYPDQVKSKATHEQVLAHLKSRGENAHEVQGHYGSSERSIIVFHPKNPEGIERIAHGLGQESIIHSDGTNHQMKYLHGSQTGKVVTGKGTVWHQEKPNDFYTTLNNKHFTHNFNFGGE